MGHGKITKIVGASLLMLLFLSTGCGRNTTFAPPAPIPVPQPQPDTAAQVCLSRGGKPVGPSSEICLFVNNILVSPGVDTPTSIFMSPFDWLVWVGILPGSQPQLTFFEGGYQYFGWALFSDPSGSSWSFEWEYNWSTWTVQGCSSVQTDYRTLFGATPSIITPTNGLPQIPFHIGDTPILSPFGPHFGEIDPYTGLTFIQIAWQNYGFGMAPEGYLTFESLGSCSNDQYLFQHHHCEDTLGNTIACPFSI